jgi:hypothetical protein
MQCLEGTEKWRSFIQDARDRPEYVVGLVQAYCALRPSQRQELVRALGYERLASPESVAVICASLLAVEDDADRTRALGALLREIGPESVHARGSARALWSGSVTAGAVVLSQPLYGSYVETFGMSWRGAELARSFFVPVMHLGQFDACGSSLPTDSTHWEDVPVRLAWDSLVDVLWKLKQHGTAWPYGLHRFTHRLCV